MTDAHTYAKIAPLSRDGTSGARVQEGLFPCDDDERGKEEAKMRARVHDARAFVARHGRATRTLAASGHAQAQQFLFVDCASEIDLCAWDERHQAEWVEETPFAGQPIVGGANDGAPLRGTHRCWFTMLGRSTPLVTGPSSKCNVLSTCTTARLGQNTVVTAPTGALHLVPQGAWLDDPCQPGSSLHYQHHS